MAANAGRIFRLKEDSISRLSAFTTASMSLVLLSSFERLPFSVAARLSSESCWSQVEMRFL